MSDESPAIWEPTGIGWRLGIGRHSWQGKTKKAVRAARDAELYKIFKDHSFHPEFLWLPKEQEDGLLGACLYQLRGSYSYILVYRGRSSGCHSYYPGKSRQEVEDYCRHHLAQLAYDPAEDDRIGEEEGTGFIARPDHPALGYTMLREMDKAGREEHAHWLRWQRGYRELRKQGKTDHQARELLR